MSRLLAATAMASTLAACGGGGGGGGAEQAQRVAITQLNAPTVAAEAIDAGGAGIVGESAPLTGAQVSTAAMPAPSTMAALAGAVRLALQAKAPTALVGATVTQTLPCTNGGNVTETVTYASQAGPTPGDRIDLTFNACVEGSETSTGLLSVTLVSATVSNSTITSLVVDATASAFTISRGVIGERLNGGMRISLDDTSSVQSVLGVTSTSFSFDRLLNGTPRATRTLSNYTYQLITTLATGQTSETFGFSASGTFPRLGTVAFDAQTTQPVVTPLGALHPSSGAGKVTGANGTSVTATVVATGVALDVDTDGDGVANVTVLRTWDQLDGEL